MAAIVSPSPLATPTPARAQRPHLVLIQGGRSVQRMEATYRRRRIVAAVLVLLVVWGAVVAVRAGVDVLRPQPVGAAPTAAVQPGTPTLAVQPGDTLWTIARRVQPSGDIRPLVHRMVAVNGSGPLVPGDLVAIPG